MPRDILELISECTPVEGPRREAVLVYRAIETGDPVWLETIPPDRATGAVAALILCQLLRVREVGDEA